MKRGVIQDNSCLICSNGAESILHALRDCQHVRSVWTQLGVAGNDRGFFSCDLHAWLSLNAKVSRSK